MHTRKYLIGAIALVAVSSLAITIPAFAQTNVSGNQQTWSHNRPNGGAPGKMGMMKPGVVGTVSAINGATLTISGRQGFGQTTSATTFTVDATNATVLKNNATSSVSSIAVGDMVAVQGTVNGSNVAATLIHDGIMHGQGRMGMSDGTTTPITGNGQPIVAGTVSAVSGSTITINNKSNIQYTIDASNAKIVQGQNTVSVSNLTVGDTVIVQGTINGSSVTASSIIDQVKTTNSTGASSAHFGFFENIGHFFMHLFGF